MKQQTQLHLYRYALKERYLRQDAHATAVMQQALLQKLQDIVAGVLTRQQLAQQKYNNAQIPMAELIRM